jgi:ABC-type enterochelin transport system ATPase subunit
VATFFPNYTLLNTIDLSGDTRSFSKFNGKNKYVIYATVYNISCEDLSKLDKNYSILKQFNNLNINITIYILNRP